MEQIEEVLIHDLAFGGAGVGRLSSGMVVFVPGALPEENVQVSISGETKRYARGKLLSIAKPSVHRITPACPLAGVCPGCCYQHVQYEQEVAYKQSQLQALLQRVGALETIPLRDPVASPEEMHYRNKIVLHVGSNGELGYVAEDNRSVIDVTDCPLGVKPITQAVTSFRDSSETANLQAGDQLTFRHTDSDGVVYWVNNDAPRNWLRELLGGTSWNVPASSFWQVNRSALPLLVQTVGDFVARCSPSYLIDLYSGAGLFSLSYASGLPHVLGVESQKEAVRAARHSAKEQNLDHVMFLTGDAAQIYPEAQSEVDANETLVIVDPPRSGLKPSLRNALLQEGTARHVVYISCAADTLARDCRELCKSKYRIADVQLIDMFPRTSHFETVVLLERV